MIRVATEAGSTQPLRVWIGDEPAEPEGLLEFRESTGEYLYRPFRRKRGGTASLSLAMPGMEAAGEAFQILHPVFGQNLPEGALRVHLEERLRQHPGLLPCGYPVPDLDLLALTGANSIGRVRVTPEAPPAPGPQEEPDILEELLEETSGKGLLDACLRRFGPDSGISGVQPKVLVGRHIVKFTPRHHPSLAFNEFLCLRAAHRAGLKAAEARLSRDGERLVITRFDLLDDGTGRLRRLGFEEACTLALRPAHGKYQGDYLEMARLLLGFLPSGRRTEARRELFASIVLSMTLRNGDAHLKNFGLLYEKSASQARLAPAYDLVTTTLYLPDDRPALTLEGHREWPEGKAFRRLGLGMGLQANEIRESLDRVFSGVLATREELHEFAETYPRHAEAARRMEQQWHEGLEALGRALDNRKK